MMRVKCTWQVILSIVTTTSTPTSNYDDDCINVAYLRRKGVTEMVKEFRFCNVKICLIDVHKELGQNIYG